MADKFFNTETSETKGGKKLTRFSINQKIEQIGVFTNNELDTHYFTQLGELHTTTFFGISVFMESDFNVDIDGTIHNIKSDSVVMEYPGQRCAIQDQARPLKSIHISFSQAVFKQLGMLFPKNALEFLYTHPHIRIENDVCKRKLSMLIMEILKTFKDENKDKTYIPHISALLIEIFVVLIQQVKKQKNDKNTNKILLFFKFVVSVNNNLNVEHNVSFYKSQLGTNKKTLTQCVYDMSGMSPKEFIDNRIIEEVTFLMIEKEKSSKDTSNLLGFKDHSNFCSYTRRRTGYAPLQYKTMIINKLD